MSKLSRKEINIFTREELKKKDTKRLLALKNKILKFGCENYIPSPGYSVFDDDILDVERDKVEIAQYCLIKEVLSTREHVEN